MKSNQHTRTNSIHRYIPYSVNAANKHGNGKVVPPTSVEAQLGPGEHASIAPEKSLALEHFSATKLNLGGSGLNIKLPTENEDDALSHSCEHEILKSAEDTMRGIKRSLEPLTLKPTANHLSSSGNGLSSKSLDCIYDSYCCVCCCVRCKAKQRKLFNKQKEKLDERKRRCTKAKANTPEEIPLMPSDSASAYMYQKLYKEHLHLEHTFGVLHHKVKNQQGETLSAHQNELDGLQKTIKMLSLELQEARDQNELLEFRVLELEHSNALCDRCFLSQNDLEDVKDAKLDKAHVDEPEEGKFPERVMVVDHEIEVKDSSKPYNKPQHILDDESPKEVFLAQHAVPCTCVQPDSTGCQTNTDHSSESTDGQPDLAESHVMALIKENNSARVTPVENQLNQKMCTTCSLMDCTSAYPKADYVADNKSDIEKELKILKEEKAVLEERVLELDEAENDARLVSQTLQGHIEALLVQIGSLQRDLAESNAIIEQKSRRIEELEASSSALKEQLRLLNANKAREEDLFLFSNSEKDKSDPGPDSGTDHSLSTEEDEASVKEGLHESDIYYSVEKAIKEMVDEDFQMFISEDRMMSAMEQIGSSFGVNIFDNDRVLYSEGGLATKNDPLPLCESIKPKKIDIGQRSPDSMGLETERRRISLDDCEEPAPEMKEKLKDLKNLKEILCENVYRVISKSFSLILK